MLQSSKANIPDFDEWYEPWREEMKRDSILKWLNEARVRVVHSGDLDAHSITRLRLSFNYYHVAAEVVSDLAPTAQPDGPTDDILDAPPAIRLADIEQFLLSKQVEEWLINESTITIERRWEDSALPGRELSGALAHCYAALSAVIQDAHRKANSQCEHDYGCGFTLRSDPSVSLAIRPPRCMSTTRRERTRVVDLDGLDADPDPVMREPERSAEPRQAREQFESVRKRYVDAEGRPLSYKPRDLISVLDVVPEYVERAQAILRSGEEHGWFVMFFRGARLLSSQVLAAADAVEKRELAKQVVEMALDLDATGIIEIGEVWTAQVALDAAKFVRPEANPEREEALIISAMTIGGASRNVVIPFSRPEGPGGTVSIGEIYEEERSVNNFLAPLRAAWKWKTTAHPSPPGSSFRRT